MKRLILYMALSLYLINTFSQESESKYDLKRAVKPSPEAASLGRYGEVPVSLNTGIPNINIPLYEIAGQDITLPISINYHNTGFKASEVSSSLGLGWSLSAGGVISRIVKGWPDEFSNGFYYTLPEYNSKIKDIQCQTELGFPCQWRLKAVNGELDLETDEYYFNFSGYSGSIAINENREIVCSPELNFKIELDDDFGSWSITTANGIRYIFARCEYTNFRYGGLFVSAWYLSEIISQRTCETIYLEYSNNGVGFKSVESALPKYRVVKPPLIHRQECVGLRSSLSQIGDQEISTTQISRIRFPKYKMEVNFEYKNDRKDIDLNLAQRRLEKIKVTSQFNSSSNYTVREYIFNNNAYFGNINDVSNRKRRLKLTSLSETLSQAQYLFEYNETSNIPPYDSPDYDHWGYYNNAFNNTLIPKMPDEYKNIYTTPYQDANKEPDGQAAQTCILKKIIYPTKGFSEFTWEPNIVSYQNISDRSTKTIGTTCTGGIISMDGTESSIAHSMQLQQVDDINMPINIKMDVFVVTESNDIEFTVSKTGANQAGYCEAYLYKAQSIQRPSGAIIILIPENFNLFNNSDCVNIYNKQYISVTPGTYVVFTVVSRSKTDMSISAYGDYTLNELIKYKDYTVGGVRIARILTHDGVDRQNDIIKTYNYKKDYLTPAATDEPPGYNRSSAKLFVDPYHSIYKYTYVDECSNDLIMTSYLVDNDGFTMNNTGYHIGYSEVTEAINNDNGFSITIFKNEIDKNSRNLVLSKKMYNDSRQPVKFIENQYITSAFMQFQTSIVQLKLIESKYQVPISESRYKLLFKEILGVSEFPKWYGIQQTKEKNFTDGINGVEMVTNYTYDGLSNTNKKHFFPTRKTYDSSNNTLITEKTRYSFDFEIPNTIIGALQNKHMIFPIEEQQLAGSTLLSSFFTQYSSSGNVSKIYRCDFSRNINVAGVDNSGNLTQNTFYDLNLELQHDQYGNILTQMKNDSKPLSYIWGYNNTLPVVQIENLSTAEIPASVKSDIAGYTFSGSKNYMDIQNDIQFLKDKLSTIIISKPYLTTIYTYRPLVGITSVTDPSGRTIYHDYDDSGRLKETYTVEDNVKKVIRKYDYHYQNQ